MSRIKLYDIIAVPLTCLLSFYRKEQHKTMSHQEHFVKVQLPVGNKNSTRPGNNPFHKSDNCYLVRDGRRFFPIGVNYLPCYLCGNHFEDYRPEYINADLDHIRRIGLDCVRVAVFWKGFEPAQGLFNKKFLHNFETFVAECKKRGIFVIPVFLIGTWTGMYDAPYWHPPGMYQGKMLELEAIHVAEFVRHFADEPTILAWDLSDEPWYLESIPPLPPRTAVPASLSRRDIATNWIARLAGAIRKVDSNHLITLGFDPEPVRADTGFALEEAAQHLDIMSYCIYPQPSYGIELDLIAYGAFQTRFFAAGKPPFLHEGPGVSSCAACEEIIAGRFRAWMYSSLANGTTGVLPWCYTDYEQPLHYLWPLDDKPQEPNFGICFADRTLKPRGQELINFAADVRRLPLDNLRLEPPNAAFVYPCDYYERADKLHAKLWRHFTVAKGANINVDLVREDCLSDDFSLLIVPGFQLRLSTWKFLRRFVENGGNLMMLFDEFFGLNPLFPELFGVEIEGLRPGTVDAVIDKSINGAFDKKTLSFSGQKMQRLWVKVNAAETIASFDDGYPFLLENSLGRGKAWLATFPFPLHLDLGEPNSSTCLAALDLFRYLRDLSGCTSAIDTDLPWVETAIFRSTADAEDWGLIINYDRSSTDGTITIAGDYSAIYDNKNCALPAVRSDDKLLMPVHVTPNAAFLYRLCRS